MLCILYRIWHVLSIILLDNGWWFLRTDRYLHDGPFSLPFYLAPAIRKEDNHYLIHSAVLSYAILWSNLPVQIPVNIFVPLLYAKDPCERSDRYRRAIIRGTFQTRYEWFMVSDYKKGCLWIGQKLHKIIHSYMKSRGSTPIVTKSVGVYPRNIEENPCSGLKWADDNDDYGHRMIAVVKLTHWLWLKTNIY